jgi:predicted AAA+ superfamily ATPase
MSLLPRHIGPMVQDVLDTFRIGVVNGPRQCGKTTLARQLCEARGGRFYSLDDPATLFAARQDPTSFAEQSGFVVIDEIQRAGDPLLLAIKAAVDVNDRRGQFLLTGSSRFLTVPTLSESLAGRVGIVDMWPLSSGEIDRRQETILDLMFTEPSAIRDLSPTQLTRNDYFDRAAAGGFPEAFGLPSRLRGNWFDSYLRTVLERDIADLAGVRRVDEIRRLTRILAARTSQELNLAQAADDAGVDRHTADTYRALLQTVYFFTELPSWSRNLTAKVSRRPKVHITDSGLAAHLLGADVDSLMRPTSPASGAVLETFVLGEIRKITTWSRTRAELFHFRDRGGSEVDIVLEAADGRVCGIEVKASRSLSAKDTAGLALVRDRLTDDFVHGVVLYTGDKVLGLGDRITALPISALWSA